MTDVITIPVIPATEPKPRTKRELDIDACERAYRDKTNASGGWTALWFILTIGSIVAFILYILTENRRAIILASIAFFLSEPARRQWLAAERMRESYATLLHLLRQTSRDLADEEFLVNVPKVFYV